MSPGLTHRPDDEHMSLPTWRVRQLQDVEHAAREAVEQLKAARATFPPEALAYLGGVASLLEDALDDE